MYIKCCPSDQHRSTRGVEVQCHSFLTSVLYGGVVFYFVAPKSKFATALCTYFTLSGDKSEKMVGTVTARICEYLQTLAFQRAKQFNRKYEKVVYVTKS